MCLSFVLETQLQSSLIQIFLSSGQDFRRLFVMMMMMMMMMIATVIIDDRFDIDLFSALK